MLRQAIIASSWLASAARRELSRFKEFIKWLRYGEACHLPIHSRKAKIRPEINSAAATGEHVLHPRHDVIEVQKYITYGLVDSPIDGWFMGKPPATLSPKRAERGQNENDLAEVMERAERALRDPAETYLGRVSLRLRSAMTC
jgi:anaphase-promoting complex subunit 4